MKPSIIACSFIITIATLLSPAIAQTATEDSAAYRLDRIERNLQVIQRQLASSDVQPGNLNDAQIVVRISNIEDDIRNLRGDIEQNSFANRSLMDKMDKMEKIFELRIGDLEKAIKSKKAAAVSAAKAKPVITTPTEKKTAPESPDKTYNFATPREHYNYAFRLLNQTQYSEAAKAFAEFTKQYPKDPLVGNAYYWQGETYYIRRDYINAADMFRQGFESLPGGPKAADNLLKLAISLNALKRNKEACVVLSQIATQFTTTAKSIAARAVQEKKRINCE